jgi:hypothetical protein
MGTLVWTALSSLEFQLNRVDVFAVNRNAAGELFRYWSYDRLLRDLRASAHRLRQ